MHSLPVLLRLSGRPVILAGTGDVAAAKRALLERAGAIVVEESADAALAIVAIDDDAEALATIAKLKERGILVNATDRADLCDFTLPAIIDRDPVLIAIGTGGASAGLAKALRQRLEGLIPQSLGQVASALSSARAAIRSRWPDPAARRKAIDAALSSGGLLDVLRDTGPQAVEDWLASTHIAAPAGVRAFTLSSDDPDQLTLEQARLLGQADTLVHWGIAPAILHRCRADALRIESATLPSPLPPGLTVQLTRGNPA